LDNATGWNRGRLSAAYAGRRKRHADRRRDTAAEIGSTARSSPGLTPVWHGRTQHFLSMMVRACAWPICWRMPLRGHRDGDNRDRDLSVGGYPTPLGALKRRVRLWPDQFANRWAAREACTIMGPKYRAAWALIGNVQAHFGSSIRSVSDIHNGVVSVPVRLEALLRLIRPVQPSSAC